MYLVLKGVALGDFAGQPYEAASLDYCKNLSQDLIYKKAKDCTDDTILACATAVAIEERKQYAKLYREYAKRFENPLGGYGGRFTAWVYNNVESYSCGNGSAMRVGPCGCFDDARDVIAEAYKSAACTHNHPEGIKGAIVTAVSIWMAFHDYAKEDIAKYADRFYSDNFYSPMSSWSVMRESKYVQGSPAVCQTTVPMAVSCFINTDCYENCVWEAIRFGWDTDTQAAIAGSIAAAYYQLFNIESDAQWNKIKDRDYFSEVRKLIPEENLWNNK
jgi:ADP-ribosylglycohydrolase family protein